MTPLFAFWTEHAVSEGADSFPHSSEVSGITVGHALVPCLEEPSIFVLRGLYDSYEGAKEALNAMGDPDWDTWLTRWKAGIR